MTIPALTATRAPDIRGATVRTLAQPSATITAVLITSHGVIIVGGTGRRPGRTRPPRARAMTPAPPAPYGTRRLRSSVRTTTSVVVTTTRRRHRAAHHRPPHTATSNGNLRPNETGRRGPVTSSAIAAKSASTDQAMHDQRLRAGVRHVISTSAGAGAPGAPGDPGAATVSRASTRVPFRAGS
jgi:hypothetical protein